MTTAAFEIVPLSAEDAERFRQHGGEIYVADETPGYPCRRCLRDAEVGEELILVSHDPFRSDSPYRSASPIFLHRTACIPSSDVDEADDVEEIPLQLRRRQLSVRSFDANEMMIDAAVIDGEDLAHTIRELFQTDQAARLHIHNAGRGCWAANVARVS